MQRFSCAVSQRAFTLRNKSQICACIAHLSLSHVGTLLVLVASHDGVLGSLYAADAFDDSSWGLHIMDGAYKIGGGYVTMSSKSMLCCSGSQDMVFFVP